MTPFFVIGIIGMTLLLVPYAVAQTDPRLSSYDSTHPKLKDSRINL